MECLRDRGLVIEAVRQFGFAVGGVDDTRPWKNRGTHQGTEYRRVQPVDHSLCRSRSYARRHGPHVLNQILADCVRV